MAHPFLKWVGGKRQLLPILLTYVPEQVEGTYYEPFIGGGALFWSLVSSGRIKKAAISDVNVELVTAYDIVRSKPNELIRLLQSWPHTEVFFYELRASMDSDPVFRAARMIYLNKTGFNGLYRVNRSGQFNVPFGKYANPKICDDKILLACSKALQGCRIEVRDFEETVSDATEGDFIYFDPPYVPVTATSNFTSYTDKGFDDNDQARVASVAQRLVSRGVQVLASNSDMPAVHSLYSSFHRTSVPARRNLNSKADARGPVAELVISSHFSTPTLSDQFLAMCP
jgi:DNA adenine methylase